MGNLGHYDPCVPVERDGFCRVNMKAFILPPQLSNALRLSGVAIDIFALIGYTFVEVGILLRASDFQRVHFSVSNFFYFAPCGIQNRSAIRSFCYIILKSMALRSSSRLISPCGAR